MLLTAVAHLRRQPGAAEASEADRNVRWRAAILGTWSGPGWSPVQSLASVLISIQSLMNAKPYHNEPGYELAQDPRDVENYNDCIRHETLRVAVCDMVGDTVMARTLPEPLRKLCRDLFVSFFEGYEMTCAGCIERGKDARMLSQPLTDHSVLLQVPERERPPPSPPRTVPL